LKPSPFRPKAIASIYVSVGKKTGARRKDVMNAVEMALNIRSLKHTEHKLSICDFDVKTTI
jgi:hypothetical protein